MLRRVLLPCSLLLLLANLNPSDGFRPGLLPAARLPASTQGHPCKARLGRLRSGASLHMTAASRGLLSYGGEDARIDENIVVMNLQIRIAELPAGMVAPPPFFLATRSGGGPVEELTSVARRRRRSS